MLIQFYTNNVGKRYLGENSTNINIKYNLQCYAKLGFGEQLVA